MNGMQSSTQERLTVALNEVFNCLNALGRKNDEVVQDAFRRQHRTLQQQFMAVVIIPVLQELGTAHLEGRVDGRNQDAAALAFKMLDSVKVDDLYLPLV